MPVRLAALLLVVLCGLDLDAADWPRFRGPGGSGVASDTSLPSTWSPEANLAWKTPLPGPGVSSPIIVNGKVLVTCYSGYGLSQEEPGEIEDLERHLVCLDLETGDKLCASIFTARDANKDGKLTAEEVAGSPLAGRLDQLDTNGDTAVTLEEFRAGMAALFGGGRGGRGGGGRGGYERQDDRPKRPQRPEPAT